MKLPRRHFTLRIPRSEFQTRMRRKTVVCSGVSAIHTAVRQVSAKFSPLKGARAEALSQLKFRPKLLEIVRKCLKMPEPVSK
jgi:hypothetical protein